MGQGILLGQSSGLYSKAELIGNYAFIHNNTSSTDKLVTLEKDYAYVMAVCTTPTTGSSYSPAISITNERETISSDKQQIEAYGRAVNVLETIFKNCKKGDVVTGKSYGGAATAFTLFGVSANASPNKRKYIINGGISLIGTIKGLTQKDGYLEFSGSNTKSVTTNAVDATEYDELIIEVMQPTGSFVSTGPLVKFSDGGCTSVYNANAPLTTKKHLIGISLDNLASKNSAITFTAIEGNTTTYQIYNVWLQNSN